MKYDEYVKSLNMKDICTNGSCLTCDPDITSAYETIFMEMSRDVKKGKILLGETINESMGELARFI